MKLTSIWTCIIVLLGLVSLRIYDPSIVEQLRVINFDYYQKSEPQVQNESIVLIDIGEQSLETFGQWPFPRQQFAQLISDLRNSNAGIIGFTTMFADEDRFGGDLVFDSWIKDNGIVMSSTTSTKGLESIAPHVGTATLGNGDANTFAYKYKSVVNNIFSKSSDGAGMLSSSPEVDGSVRRIPLVISVEDKLYPSFGMEVVRVMSGKKSYTMKVEETGIENMRIPPYEPVVTDYTGSIYVDWSNTFERYEYGDVQGEWDRTTDFQGKTVLIGVTAEGISPLVTTPMGLKYPHDIQASVIHTLTGDKQITRPQSILLVEVCLLFFVGLLLLLSVYYLPIWLSAVVFGGSVVGVVAGGFEAFAYGMLFDFSYGLILFILLFSHSSFNNFYINFKLKQQIQGQFGNYISPEYVDMIVKDPSLMKLGGERKEMSFMFADIVGFTPISESYMEKDDPEGLVELINEFLDKMTKIVLKNGGTIDKYMGDCIMAFWNAPIPCENHAEMAVKTSIEIELLGDELEEKMKDMGLPRVKFGTGVNTGVCIVGNMGSESRMDYSVVGDAVNLGARLEAQTRQEDTPIIVSEFTYNECPDISFSALGEVKVKGKEQPVKMYAPLIEGEVRKLYKD
jgi:adenylate cyclase